MKNYSLINTLHAQEDSTPQKSQISIASFVPLVLIFFVFYWLIIRPQNKKFKEHQQMVNNLKVGTKIITNSGIYGIIKDINQNENIIDLEIANSVVIKIQKNSIGEIFTNKKEDSKEQKNVTKKK
jgi:preprotein translocase subunit YajC